MGAGRPHLATAPALITYAYPPLNGPHSRQTTPWSPATCSLQRGRASTATCYAAQARAVDHLHHVHLSKNKTHCTQGQCCTDAPRSSALLPEKRPTTAGCSCTKSTRTYQCKERAPNRAPHTCKVNFIVLRPVEAAAGHHAAVFPKKTGPWVAPRNQRPAGSRTRQIRGAGQIRAICSMRPSQCRFTDRHYQSLRKLISGLCSSSQSAGADLRSQEGLWAAQLRRACNSAPWSGCQQDQD
jgi:hypothetical protein